MLLNSCVRLQLHHRIRCTSQPPPLLLAPAPPHAVCVLCCHTQRARSLPATTGDLSRDNLWLALFTFGEGLHNSHHSFPHSARHGLEVREGLERGSV